MDCGGGLGNSIHAPLLQVRTLYFRRHLQAIVIEKAKKLENLLEKYIIIPVKAITNQMII